MTVVTRQAARVVQEYVEQVKKEDFSVPSDITLRAVSSMLDASFHRSFESYTGEMEGTPQINRGVNHIHTKRLCGGFKPSNASLEELTTFEQMFAVSSYIQTHPNMSRQPRSYALRFNDDEVIPLWIRHPQKGSASLWTTLLGSTSGRLKAPSYQDLAEEDPWGTDLEVFVDSLTCLEMHRNPTRVGALAIKAACYESDVIGHEWRFQNYAEDGEMYCSASAELKKQKTKKTRDMVAQAAGYNLCEILQVDGIRDSDRNLAPVLNFEDYAPDGYDDDTHPNVTARSIVRTLPKALKGDTRDLDELTDRIFATRLGISNIPRVFDHALESLFKADED